MRKIALLLILSFWAVLVVAGVSGRSRERDATSTVIVSLDGFRWDYPAIHDTPNLDAMARRGVSATMRPSYPASTFPNHYTLVTGLVPDRHGIVDNTFWDRRAKRQYSISDTLTRNDPRYYRGEPIWATAERQGVTAGSLYWIGSDIRGMTPAYYKEWADEPRLTFNQRINTALVWLAKPAAVRPRLITLYMEEPDGSGHRSGPGGDETRLTVRRLDSLVGVLVRGIERLPHSERVNLIVTADHGMASISPERFVKIDDTLIPPQWYHRISGTNPASIFCSPVYCDSIYDALSRVEHLRVFRKGEMPPSFDYGANENIGDLVVVPDCGWQFGVRASSSLGAHGYDADCNDMHVIFFACGPDFRRNYRGDRFDNTAIYSLLAKLLGIDPAPTDGDAGQITQFLKEKE